MSSFSKVSQKDYYDFAQQYPFAWIVPHGAPQHATLMPVLFDDHNCLSLFSHLPLRAPIVEALRTNAQATCLFLGPHSYISPEWIGSDSWVPTWNFTSVKISGLITLSPELARETVERLTKHMQKNSRSDWSIKTVEHRMEGLLPKIIGLTMTADTITPRFKLGQDETPENLKRIKDGLGSHALGNWMP
ncbi:MAG: FMN-binding negative transcriptional regulator [Alphaproteobacteria bacterium]